MGNLCGPQLVPPTQKSAKFVFIIKIIMVFQVLVALINIVAIQIFLREGLFGLCFLLLLYYAYNRLSYLCVLVYTFASIFFAIQFLVFALTIAQKGNQYVNLENMWVKYYLIVACISCLFYLFNSIFLYFPYKEFKTIQFFENPAFSEVMASSAAQRHPQEMNQVNNQQIDYGHNQENIISNKKGTFQVFKGQGVRIG